MGDDVCVTALLVWIFKPQEITPEMVEAYRPSDCKPSDPINLLTEDFICSFKAVLNVRSVVVLHRWRKLFDTCYREMLSSHFMYMRFMMFACISEDNYINHIFEKFLSVCAFVKLLCDETLVKIGVNFSDWNFHIAHAFYRCRLKVSFCKRGGFRRFVEYIRDHRYLRWKLNEKYSVSPEDPAAFFNATKIDLDKKLKKELEKERVIEKEIHPSEVENHMPSIHLVEELLENTEINFPRLPSCPEPVMSMDEYMKKQLKENVGGKKVAATEELEAMNASSLSSGSSNSESKARHDASYQDNIDWCENIIQAVIRHNRAKCSNNERSNNSIQKEAEDALEQLKENMESLLEVLTEYDEE